MDHSTDYDFSISNEELLEQCKLQDHEALRVLFRRHERPVYSLLYRMLSSKEDAEEALAEVFVKVWRGAASFKGGSKFTTWLYRIAANTARDYLRSRRTRKEVSVEDLTINEANAIDRSASALADPAKAALQSEGRNLIYQAMAGLSEEDRLLVTLYHFEEMEYDEISRITGISPDNLKVRLFRARQRLKKLCAEQEKGESNEMRTDTSQSTGLQQGSAEFERI